MRVVFLGPPGVGNGTQAARVAERTGWPRVSTGDMFRAAQRNGDPLGEKARAYLAAGTLVPDDLVIDLVRRRLQQPDCRAGVLLDGVPRTRGQAERLDEVLAGTGSGLDAVLFFQAPDEQLVARLAGRRVCGNCQAVFHLESKPPRAAGKCDQCGGELKQRVDDQEETIRRRLEVYRAETAALVDYYRERGLLCEVDAARPVDAVAGDVSRELERGR